MQSILFYLFSPPGARFLKIFCRSVLLCHQRVDRWGAERRRIYPTTSLFCHLQSSLYSTTQHSMWRVHTYIILVMWRASKNMMWGGVLPQQKLLFKDLLPSKSSSWWPLVYTQALHESIWQHYPNTHKHWVHEVKIHIHSNTLTVPTIPNYK